MIDLRRLNHLVALADERHFARGAQRVHLSQPAFSRSIQAIERDIGMRLFDRESGDVHPTPAGEFLIGKARRLLFDARCLDREVDLYRDSQLGDTAFGVGPFPAATLMPRVLSELRRLHPKVGLRVEVSNFADLFDRLHAEDIEFFIADVRNLPESDALDIRPLARRAARFYVRRGHPLAGHPCTLAALWRHGVATTKLPKVVKAALAKAAGLPPGHEPAVALECDDFAILRSVALSTDTVLAATDAATRADVESGALLPLDVKNLPPQFSEMGTVSLHNRTPSPMAQRAIACIERIAGEVNQPPINPT